MRKLEEKKRATICHHLLMHMWLKIKKKAVVEVKLKFSMAEANPGGNHSHIQSQLLFAIIAVRKATKEMQIL